MGEQSVRKSEKPLVKASSMHSGYHSWFMVCVLLAQTITSQFVPDWKIEELNLDVAASLLNMTGAVIQGIARGATDDTYGDGPVAADCIHGFVAVWTSLTFTMEQSAALSQATGSLLAGLAYTLLSILLGVAVFAVGYSLGECYATSVQSIAKSSMPCDRNRGHMMPVLISAMAAAVVRARFLSVEKDHLDPKGADYSEDDRLLLSMAMALAGVYVGDFVGSIQQDQWSSCRANGFALLLVSTAFRAAHTARWLLSYAPFQIFTATFCGAVSGFGSLTEDIYDDMRAGNVREVMINVSGTITLITFTSLVRLRGADHVDVDKFFSQMG
ncbi:unnamed protein product [Chrysoparadoxa australica]